MTTPGRRPGTAATSGGSTVDPERIKEALEHAEDMAGPIKSRWLPDNVRKGLRTPFECAKTP